MAWMTVTESMERVLSSTSTVPASQRLGPIDGVMVKDVPQARRPARLLH